jgi:hypothetical protein
MTATHPSDLVHSEERESFTTRLTRDLFWNPTQDLSWHLTKDFPSRHLILYLNLDQTLDPKNLFISVLNARTSSLRTSCRSSSLTPKSGKPNVTLGTLIL